MLQRIIKKYGLVDYTDSNGLKFVLSKAVFDAETNSYCVPLERKGVASGSIRVRM